MDLSKAFDTLNQNSLIAKLGPLKALNYIKNYLNNRKQIVFVNSNFSSWQEIIAGVPLGSILGSPFLTSL